MKSLEKMKCIVFCNRTASALFITRHDNASKTTGQLLGKNRAPPRTATATKYHVFTMSHVVILNEPHFHEYIPQNMLHLVGPIFSFCVLDILNHKENCKGRRKHQFCRSSPNQETGPTADRHCQYQTNCKKNNNMRFAFVRTILRSHERTRRTGLSMMSFLRTDMLPIIKRMIEFTLIVMNREEVNRLGM